MTALLVALLLSAPDGGSLSRAALTRPVGVHSDTLQIFARENRAVYSGHARATRDAAVITCDQLTVRYSQGQEVTRVEAEGHVEVVEGDRWAKGDRADFDNLTGVLVVLGSPEARQKTSHVAGSKVTFTVGNDLIEVEDARTLFEDSGTVASGAPKPKGKPSRVAVDAKHLKVYGKKNEAVWSGNVKARRGPTRINTDRLIAHYGDDQEVTRVEAEGGVEVQDGEKWARGDHADFDNLRGLLVVTGNPIARQGDSWVKGTRVTFTVGDDRIDVEKAESLIHTKPLGHPKP